MKQNNRSVPPKYKSRYEYIEIYKPLSSEYYILRYSLFYSIEFLLLSNKSQKRCRYDDTLAENQNCPEIIEIKFRRAKRTSAADRACARRFTKLNYGDLWSFPLCAVREKNTSQRGSRYSRAKCTLSRRGPWSRFRACRDGQKEKFPETIFSVLLDGHPRIPHRFPLPAESSVNGTGLSVVMPGWRRVARRYARRRSSPEKKKKQKQEEGRLLWGAHSHSRRLARN